MSNILNVKRHEVSVFTFVSNNDIVLEFEKDNEKKDNYLI